MKSIVIAVGVLAGLLGASEAFAEQAPGPYIAADVGYNWKSDQQVTSQNLIGSGNSQRFAYRLSTKDQAAGFARLGWRFNDSFRVELEGGYRPGKVNAAHGPQANYGLGLKDDAICGTVTATVGAVKGICSQPGGKIDQTTLFVNAIYDAFPEYSLHPYVGLGIGVDYINGSVSGRFAQANQSVMLKGHKAVPAAQALLGVSQVVGSGLRIDLTYRLTYAGKVKYATTTSGALNPGAFEGDLNDEALTIGLRYALGHATPPAPAAAAPAPVIPVAPAAPVAAPAAQAPVAASPASRPDVMMPRQFIVYFRFNQSGLTPDAEAVVRAAANYATAASGLKQVSVVGYTDTSGSAAYNIKLSQRRADATAKALIAYGVPQAAVSSTWKGETDPAVQTADGVKEPQNRRATIDIAF